MRYSSEFKKKAIQLYQQGLSSREVAETLGCGQSSVSLWLKEFRIEPNPRYSVAFKKKAVALYKHCLSSGKVAQTLGCSDVSVLNWIKEYGIQAQPQSRPKYSANDNYFSEIDSEEKAYWVGFLLADGSLSKNVTTVRLRLKAGDQGHIIKFRDSLSSTHPIYHTKQNCVEILLARRQLYDDLIAVGVTPRKSLTARPAGVPEQFRRHYFRGLFDGDGCISYIKSLRDFNISLVGTKAVVADFSQWLGYNGRYVYERTGARCYYFSKRGRDVPAILHRLYHNGSIYLDRKYEMYTEVMRWHEKSP